MMMIRFLNTMKIQWWIVTWSNSLPSYFQDFLLIVSPGSCIEILASNEQWLMGDHFKPNNRALTWIWSIEKNKMEIEKIDESNWIVPLLFTGWQKTINWKKMLQVTTQLYKNACHYDVAIYVCISLLKQTEPLLAPLDSQW